MWCEAESKQLTEKAGQRKGGGLRSKAVHEKWGWRAGYIPPGVRTHETQTNKKHVNRIKHTWFINKSVLLMLKVLLQSQSTRWRPLTGWTDPDLFIHSSHLPSFKSHPSLSGLKKVCVRSFPSSSGILKGSFLMLSYRFYTNEGAMAQVLLK